MDSNEHYISYELYDKYLIEDDYETEYLEDEWEWVKAVWHFIETLFVSKGFPTPMYWLRTRSNPHRDNYH